MSKKVTTTVFSALILAVLCAGTVSARQLRTGATGFATCGGSGCSATKPCKTGCICVVLMETGNTFCSSHPIPGATVLK